MAEKKSWRERYEEYVSGKTDKEKTNSDEGTSSWRENYEKNYGNASAQIVGKNVVEKYNAWLNNFNSYATDYQNRYSGRKGTYEDAYVSDSADWLDTATKRKSELDAEADEILSYLQKYGGHLDASFVKNIKSSLGKAKNSAYNMVKGAQQDHEYWNSFGSEELLKEYGSAEEAYKAWATSTKETEELKNLDLDAAAKDLEDFGNFYDEASGIRDWIYLYNIGLNLQTDPAEAERKLGIYNRFMDEFGGDIYAVEDAYIEKEKYLNKAKQVQEYEQQLAFYNAYANNSDFAEKSAYKSTYRGGEVYNAGAGIYTDTGFDDIDYDYINRNETAMARKQNNAIMTNQAFWGLDKSYLLEMTNDEIAIYNYLYQTDKPKSEEYLAFLLSDLSYRQRKRKEEEASAYAKEHPFLASGFSVATSPLKALSALGQVADYAADGTVDQNAGYNKFSYTSTAIRNQVASDIEKSGKWGKVGSWTYQLGMSMGDFLVNSAVSGGSSALSLALMGSGAMADTVISAKDRGLSDDQAMILGVVAGAAEIVTEKFSLDALFKGDLSKGTMRYILTNAFTEGTEEVSSSLINTIADVLVSKDKSEWAKAIEEYLAKNPDASESEAFQAVLGDNLLSLGLDFLGGALMGGTMGSVGAGINYVANARPGLKVNKDAVKMYGDSTNELIKEGLLSDPNSDSYDLAKHYQKKTEKGKALSGYEIRNLVKANEAQFKVENYNDAVSEAKTKLAKMGETENIDSLAKLVAKRATGQELTRAEKSTLANNQYGSKVAKEMRDAKLAEAGIETATYRSLEERVGKEAKFSVSKTGTATISKSGTEIDLRKPEIVDFVRDKETGKVTDMILNVDGKEVKASEIDFADADQSYLYSAVKNIENITPGDAQAIVRDYNPSSGLSVGEYLNGVDEAYTYGYYGYPEADLKAGNFAPKLSSEQAKGVYEMGKYTRNTGATNADAPVVRMRTALEASLTAEQKTAKQKARFDSENVEVYFEDGGTVVKFDKAMQEKYEDHQIAAVKYAEFLSKLGIGGKFYFYKSYEKNGKRVYMDADGKEVTAPNGRFVASDGSIHIDLYAGDHGQGVTLFTLAHELTHFIREWSKAKFNVLADFLIEEYGKTNMTMHERVLAKQKDLQEVRGKNAEVTYDEAFEEVVADAMSTMLADGNLHEKLAKLKSKDKDLFNKIKQFFERLIAKFQAMYKDLPPEQQDAIDVRNMKDAFDKIQQAFAEALVEASENFQAAMESVVEANAEPMSADEIVTDGAVVTDGNGERQSIRSMKHDIAEGKMFEDLKNVCGWTNAQVNTLRTQLKDLVDYMIPYRTILDMNENYGMEGRRFSPYKPNSDPLYKISMDFSTLCSKRLLTQYVIEQLQLRENRPMSAEEQMAIRDMLNEYRKVEKGLQVACSMCYVEAARLKSPKQIQRWLNDPAPLLRDYFGKKNKAFNDSVKKAQADFKESKGYDREAPKKDMKQADIKELNKIGPEMRSQYQPSAEEQAIIEKAKTLPNSTYLTAGNLADLSETDPVIYDAYTAFVRTATRSKSLEKDEPYYYGDSTRDNGNGIVVTDSFIEAVNKENGMRFSSWSDWRIHHLLDYITAVIDNSVRGAAMHGYTKFGDEVRVLGKTGMMFNMSGVTGTQTGLNDDGSLNFSETESIDVNEAIQLREEFPEHAGLQCIGVSDAHIIALLRSDIIDYVIPYHVSGLNADLRRMAKIYGWDDYTGTQHAAIDKSIKLEDAVDKEHWREEPVFSEFFVGYDTGMTGIEAMRASAEKYKQMCNDRGLTPKFNQFATEDNYWKLLIDRKMINQQTGNLIRQKAVTPTFDFDVIKGVVDKFVDNYDSGLEGRALNHIVENWDSIPQHIKDLKKKGGTKAKKTNKAVNTLANQTVAAQPKDGDKNSDRKWKPVLDSTEWGLVKYAVDNNQGTEITSICNMFIKKSKGRTVFGIYSTADSTLLYASRKKTAEREHLFAEQFLKEYENGNVTDTSAEGLYTWAKTVRMQQDAGTGDDSGDVAPGRSAGDATLYGRPFGLYSSAALRNVLENIFQKETAGRSGDGRIKKSERDSTGKQLTKEQQEFFKYSKVRDENGNLMVMYHGTANGGAFTVFDGDKLGNDTRTTQAGQGFYFTNMKNEAESYTKNVDIYGKMSAGRNPHLHQVYLNIANPFDIGSDTLDIGKVKSVYMDGTYEYFFNNWIPFYLNKKTVNGRMFSKSELQEMSKSEKVSAYVDYLSQLGTKEVLSNMVRAFPYGKQSELLESMKKQLGYDGIVEEFKPGQFQYVAFSSEQVKSTDNTNPTFDPDIRYSERGDGASNRSLLANAFETITKDSIEYKMIQKYKSHIKDLNALEKELGKLNSQIYEIRFTKGKYDAKKLAELESKADAIASEINRQDRELLSLEASEPLRKVIERERKKEAQKTKDHVKEIQENKKAKAEQTELRHKIRKAVRDLDKILKHGNKKQNVKEDMQNVVTKALQAADILFTDNYGTYDMLRNGIVTEMSDAEEKLVATCTKMLKDLDKMPTDGYENWQARQEAENKLRTKMAGLKEVFARERKRLNNATVSSILGELANAYAAMKDSEQSYVQGAYSEPVYNFLVSLQSEVGGTIVKDMTKAQLESVYAAYKMVLESVRNANKMFNEELKQSREQLANAVIEEVLKAGGVHLLGTKMGDKISQFDWNNMKPIWLGDRIGSETFGKLMNGLFKGQYNFAVDIDEAKRFKLEMDKKYHPRNWDAEKLYEFESSTGKKFSLDLQQIMSLYAFSKREQAYSHLLNGGFVFEENSTVVVDGKLGIKKTYIHKGAASYKVNEATLNDIVNSLTAEQKAYVDEMQKYLSETMGAKGNEVSMRLYGIKMFNEQFYFPLRSSGAYMERAKEAEMKKQQGQINLVNSGFAHAVKPQAKNPIVLSGFMDVWAEHCNEMSMYHSMVLPMEDFRKVYNYTTVHDENMDSASVFQTIQDAYGKAATGYIDQLYRELNAGATVDPRETPWMSLISNFKKAMVMLSASVWVQQFSSIGRAYAVIDPKYFTGTKVNSDTKLSSAEEMKKYAPVAIIKEMGGFDTGTKGSAKSYIMAEQYGKGERLNGLVKDKQYRSDIMGYLPTKADEKTWCAIWEACKRETKAKNPKMDIKSEEFLKLAGERFSEVIEKTQVYDSVLARSANMRSKGGLMQMATAFMAEPTTTINLLENAIRSGNKGQIARAFGAVAVSIVLNNALASIVYAMRDDDDDETFIEKYFQSFTSGLVDDINPMSYYPFLKDVYSLFQGYDVERTDMSVIADIRDAMKKAVGLLGKDTSGMDDDELAEHYKQWNEVIMGILDAGCSAFGVPVKNIRRDVNGLINAFSTIGEDLSGERKTTWFSFWDKVGSAVKDTIPIYAWTKDEAKTDKLYNAIISGDKAYLDRLKSGYKTEDAYHTAVRKALRENDPRIREAALAQINGDPSERVRIAKLIIADGFNQDDVVAAINSEINALTESESESGTAKAKGLYKAEDFVREYANGDMDNLDAILEDILDTAQKNGKTQEEAEKDFASDVRSKAKDVYLDGSLDDATAEKLLVEYADMDEDEAASRVSYWAFCKEHSEYKDIYNEAHVAKYYEFAEPAKISVDVYAQFIEGTKGLADIKDKWGDVEKSVREQKLEVIDSLPLTWQQKDALYLAAGYAESKIWDVPW